MQTEGGRKTLRDALALLWSVADCDSKARVSLALLLVTGAGIVAAFAPLALKRAIDALTGTVPGQVSVLPFVYLALYAAGLYLVRLFTELRLRTHGHAEQHLRRRMSRRLFDHLLRLPLRFHLEQRSGALAGSSEQGLRGYDIILLHVVQTVLPVTVELLTVVGVLAYLGHPVYIGLLALAALAYIVAFQRGAADIRSPAERGSAATIEGRALLADALMNYECVKFFDAEAQVGAKYDTALGRALSAWCEFYNRRAINGYLVSTIFFVAIASASGYAGYQVMDGSMTIGDFALVHAYFLRLVQPLEALGFAIRDITQGLAFLQTLLELVAIEPERQHGQRASPTGRGELVFQRVSFAYSPERTVLREVSFTVPAGTTVAVVGASGAGKSSLVRLLLRLLEPTGGSILIDGQPIAALSLSALRRRIAVVPQDTALFHDTIASNIALGRPEATMAEIEAAARLASLDDFIRCLPSGYETVVGERGLKLSGGERQRVAIARAALVSPAIIVCDEATSSLDAHTEHAILRNLRALTGRCTTLVIAHRLSTVIHADQIVVLDHGAIVERGTHAELIRSNGCYAALYRAQDSGRSVSELGLVGQPLH